MSITPHSCTHSALVLGLGNWTLIRLCSIVLIIRKILTIATITDRGYSDTVLDVLAVFSGVGRMASCKSCSSSIL